MNIDLKELFKNSRLEINETLNINTENLVNTDVVDIKDTKVSGDIHIINDEVLSLNLTLKGIMILLDSVSLEEIKYPFDIKIDENIELNDKKHINNSNTLDIFDILWENIVLEIPTRIVQSEKEFKAKGDGWSLNEKRENQLSALKELLDMEEEK